MTTSQEKAVFLGIPMACAATSAGLLLVLSGWGFVLIIAAAAAGLVVTLRALGRAPRTVRRPTTTTPATKIERKFRRAARLSQVGSVGMLAGLLLTYWGHVHSTVKAEDVDAARACELLKLMTLGGRATAGEVESAARPLIGTAVLDEAAGREPPKWAYLGGSIFSLADEYDNGQALDESEENQALAGCASIPNDAKLRGGFVQGPG